MVCPNENKQCIQHFNSSSDQVKIILLSASQKDLEDANYRYRSIEPILFGQAIKNSTVSERTRRVTIDYFVSGLT
jgi:hypothetical protein